MRRVVPPGWVLLVSIVAAVAAVAAYHFLVAGGCDHGARDAVEVAALRDEVAALRQEMETKALSPAALVRRLIALETRLGRAGPAAGPEGAGTPGAGGAQAWHGPPYGEEELAALRAMLEGIRGLDLEARARERIEQLLERAGVRIPAASQEAVMRRAAQFSRDYGPTQVRPQATTTLAEQEARARSAEEAKARFEEDLRALVPADVADAVLRVVVPRTAPPSQAPATAER